MSSEPRAPLAPQAFKDALSHLASGVTIVAAKTDGGVIGMTATAFASTSLNPPLILVCVAKKSSVHDPLVAAKTFGVSMLAAEQRWIADQCARPGEDRFNGIALRPAGAADAPLVDGALAVLGCIRYATHEVGDHTILVGEVVEAHAGPIAPPLMYHARRYGTFDEKGVPPGK